MCPPPVSEQVLFVDWLITLTLTIFDNMGLENKRGQQNRKEPRSGLGTVTLQPEDGGGIQYVNS